MGLHARAPGSDSEADFSQAWQAFWDASNGQMESADGLWSWTTLYPAQNRDQLIWKAASLVPHSELQAIRTHIWGSSWPPAPCCCCCLVPVWLHWCAAGYKKQLAQQEAARLAGSKVISSPT